jgi:probable F420-dependent oxidoreductase
MKAETLLPLGKLDPGLAQPEAALDTRRVVPESQIADSVGYHAILMEETKDDPFQILALAAQATERVHVGTSVAIAFPRSPYVTAMAAWTLQKLSGGRFELGLGSQVGAHIRRRFGMQSHPAGPWMRDYVLAVKAIWHSWQTETEVDIQSDHYNINLSVPLFTPAPLERPDIPVLLAAVNPYMCGVAAEVADGVRLHPVCSRRYIVDEVVPAVQRKRDPNADKPFEICLKPLIATGPDDETLTARIEIARQRLAFYVSTPAYRRPFENAGLLDLAKRMSVLPREGRWDEMAAMIDDEVLHEWVIVAKYDELAEAINTRFGDVLDRIEVSIPMHTAADEAQMASVIREIAQ